jgi:DNA-binding winged helix-turn-helix (wHTH) protein
VRAGWRLFEGGWKLRDPIGTELLLTTAERAFLRCLFQASGEPVSRAELISRLGGDPQSADPHRVDVLVNRLRRKAAAFGMQLPLHSVRGKGYTLTTDSVRTDDDLVLAPQPDPAATTFDGFAPRPRPWTPASPRRAWHEPSPRPPASMVSRRPRPL